MKPAKIEGKRSWAAASCGALALLVASASVAQTYPSKPIRLVVPYSAGTTTDVLGRLYAQKLSENLGQAIIVENRAGAGGNIAGEAVAKAAPDGYTITLSTSAVHATNPALYGKLPFDTLRDFSHVTFLASAPNMLVVNSTVPANKHGRADRLRQGEPGQAHLHLGGFRHLAAHVGRTAEVDDGHRDHARALQEHHAGFRGPRGRPSLDDFLPRAGDLPPS